MSCDEEEYTYEEDTEEDAEKETEEETEEEKDTEKETEEETEDSEKIRKKSLKYMVNKLNALKRYSIKYDFIVNLIEIYDNFQDDYFFGLLNGHSSQLFSGEYEILLDFILNRKNKKTDKQSLEKDKKNDKKGYSSNYGGSQLDTFKSKISDKLESLETLEQLLIFLDKYSLNDEEINILVDLKYFIIEARTDENTNSKVLDIINDIVFILESYSCLKREYQICTKLIKNNQVNIVQRFKYHNFRDSVKDTVKDCLTTLQTVSRELNRIKKSDINSNGIYFAVSEENMCLFKFLIIGPKDTPYEGGYFLFDGVMDDMPKSNPKIIFMTTGGGSFRFNPNLYACGKVCLSLLGTWSGPGWNSEESSILQLLMSILSFIFVSEPYYNEPGHIDNESASKEYNNKIINGTKTYAFRDSLKNDCYYPFNDNLNIL